MRPLLHYDVSALPRDERDLLQAAAAWNPQSPGDAIRAEDFARLTASRGIDFATAVLFDRLRRRPATHEIVNRSVPDTLSVRDTPVVPPDALLAVVPGVLYREYPKTGADGRVIRDIAESLGWQTELVALPSDGPPAQNGELLLEWLARRSHRPVLLVSLSKGGADVKAALALTADFHPFRSVIGWINFGGILNGSPMAAWIMQRRLARVFFRGLFRCTGHDFRMMTELEYHNGRSSPVGTPMSTELRLPKHVCTIHVAGFPLRKHLSSPRARRWHKRLSPWGPNDSVTILADAASWPGIVWPVWGTDHYLQARWHPERLMADLLRCVGKQVEGPGSRDSADRPSTLDPQPRTLSPKASKG